MAETALLLTGGLLATTNAKTAHGSDPRPVALPPARRGRRTVRPGATPARCSTARRATCPASPASTRRSRALPERARTGWSSASRCTAAACRRRCAPTASRRRPARASARSTASTSCSATIPRSPPRPPRRARGSTTSAGRSGSPSCTFWTRRSARGSRCRASRCSAPTARSASGRPRPSFSRGCARRGLAIELVTTGQTGWLQGHRYGFVLDATPNDFVTGELERAVVACAQRGDAGPDPDRGTVGAAQSERSVRRGAGALRRGARRRAPARAGPPLLRRLRGARSSRIPPVEERGRAARAVLRRARARARAERRGPDRARSCAPRRARLAARARPAGVDAARSTAASRCSTPSSPGLRAGADARS